jgi:hypothetical protein
MSMHFTNLVKAQITQGLVKTLFERAGYRVIRLGVEELFADVIYLDQEKYLALDLPEPLRRLPDLLVADTESNKTFLLEVKFRKDLTESSAQGLYDELKRQRLCWPTSHAVILVADSFVDGGRFHQDYIRILRPEQTEILNVERLRDYSEVEQFDFDNDDVPQIIWEKQTFKTRGMRHIWDSLSPLNEVFERFGHKTGNYINADLITGVIKDLRRL